LEEITLKKELLAYENGDFTKVEIDWIEQTEETTRNYITEYYHFEDEEHYQDLLSQINPNEEDINKLFEIIRLEKGIENYIIVYQYFKEYDYIVSIEYGELTYPEWFACKDFKTLLSFLKEIEPLLNLIEQNDTIGYLEAILDEMKGILEFENFEWIHGEKQENVMTLIRGNFENIEEYLQEWIKRTKRKPFMLNDLCKDIIKANKTVNLVKVKAKRKDIVQQNKS
jgi:hypothetical protein